MSRKYQSDSCPPGGGVLPEKLGGGVWPASQNPYPMAGLQYHAIENKYHNHSIN